MATTSNLQLFLAIMEGDLETVRTLTNPTHSSPTQHALTDALHAAITWNHPDIALLLLDRGANINAPHKNDNPTALHRVLETGDYTMTQLLLDRGATINLSNAGFCGPGLFLTEILDLLNAHGIHIPVTPEYSH